jgi:cysteine-rich repeat protein
MCGDGVEQAGEGCDDGNLDDSDGCLTTCVEARCGDGFTQPAEDCDDGNANDNDACTNGCAVAMCGDGLVNKGVEACDDGNDDDTDGCVACQWASCGDGVVEDGVEECDEGAANALDGACLPGCVSASCGDGLVESGVEGCDDGNLVDGDWCSGTCAKECIAGDKHFLAADGICYSYFADALAWADARNVCAVLGSHLASIASSDENGIVQGLVTSGRAWIGLTDTLSAGTWLWVEGPEQVRVPTFLNFADGAPTTGHCASLGTDGKWLDGACTTATAYVCEHAWE